MRNDTAIFIITHQRADKQLTLKMLKQLGYSGKVYLVVDDMDCQLQEYRKRYGDNILVFSKKKYAEKVDTHINKFRMSSAVFARNACIDMAKEMGLNFYFVCDDDIKCTYVKDGKTGKMVTHKITDIEAVLSKLVGFMENTRIHAVAFADNGAYIGGINQDVRNGVKYVLTKFMLYRTDDPVIYESIMWEDQASCYRDLGVGKIDFSIMFLSAATPPNEKSAGGCADMYRASTDYANSFMVLMARPDCVKIVPGKEGECRMRTKQTALHPMILHEKYRRAGELG